MHVTDFSREAGGIGIPFSAITSRSGRADSVSAPIWFLSHRFRTEYAIKHFLLFDRLAHHDGVQAPRQNQVLD